MWRINSNTIVTRLICSFSNLLSRAQRTGRQIYEIRCNLSNIIDGLCLCNRTQNKKMTLPWHAESCGVCVIDLLFFIFFPPKFRCSFIVSTEFEFCKKNIRVATVLIEPGSLFSFKFTPDKPTFCSQHVCQSWEMNLHTNGASFCLNLNLMTP